MSQEICIDFVPGSVMPKFEGNIQQLTCENVVITEQAMESRLPALDFMCSDAAGNRFWFQISGRLAIAIAAAVQGVNIRNHGKANP